MKETCKLFLERLTKWCQSIPPTRAGSIGTISLKYSPDSVTLGNAEYESAGQTLFICDYDLVSQTGVEGSGDMNFVYRARLQNTGATFEGASAQLTLLASPEPGYLLDFQATELIGIAQIQGGDGNDTIYGNDDANVIVGGKGTDRLYGMGGITTDNAKPLFDRAGNQEYFEDMRVKILGGYVRMTRRWNGKQCVGDHG